MGLRIKGHKSLCAPVTICDTLIVPKSFLSIVTPLTAKSRSNPRKLLHPVRCTNGANLVTAGQLLAEIMQI